MRRIFAGIGSIIVCLCLTSCVFLRDTGVSHIPENADETEAFTGIPGQNIPGVEGNADTDMPEAEKPYTDDPYLGVDISFLAAGDNLIHPNIYMDAQKRGTAEKEYDFLPVYSDVAPYIAAADFSFINQETVMAGEQYGYSGWPNFNCPQQLGLDLVEVGFDIIGIANNHMLDKGTQALSDTMDFWHTQPVIMTGSYYNAEDAANIRTMQADGVNIAILSYTYGTNGISKRADSPIVIPYIDDELILSDLAAAKKTADFIIVSIHWGDEYASKPNNEQVRLAELMADNGANVILGHHSHSLQPITWLDGEKGKVLCIYSLGNFISGMRYPINMVGGMLTFRITSDGQGSLCAADPMLIPTVFYYGMNWFDTHLYLLEDYTEEIAAGHGVWINGDRLGVEKARKLVTDVIDKEFLPDYLQ
ncbi:MAG: CapA family protein [Clostridia bacterium]|nr:CapA family protein [Clostridia bacterium]